jgi:ATP-dependent DNA helicase RecG
MATDIMTRLGLRHRPTLRTNYLSPAIRMELTAMTIPDKPNSRLQKYRLTPKGKAWLASNRVDSPSL